MFNIINAKVSKDTRKMGWFAKLKLGALAVDVATWAADVARTIDFDAVLKIAADVLDIERNMRGVAGAFKLEELLKRLEKIYPGGNIAVAIGYVKSIVALLNALGVFKK